MKKTLFFIFFVISLNSMAIYQMRNWTLPPNKIQFNLQSFGSTPPTVTSITGATSAQYRSCNAAFDENSNLLFYVKDNVVYNPSSTSMGTLSDYTDISGVTYTIIGNEIAIVPIPGQCSKFYVIFSKYRTSSPFASALLYSIVDCSSGGVVVTSTYGYSTSAQKIDVVTNATRGLGIAVSTVKGGSGSSAYRYLYVSGGWSVKRYTVNSSGFSAITPIFSTSTAIPAMPTNTIGDPMCTNELELSQNGNSLTWAGVFENHVFVINPLPGTTSYTTYTFPCLDPINGSTAVLRGIEFDANNNIYVSTACGLNFINTSSGTITPIASSSNFNNTSIELGYDSKLYVVNNSGNLAYVEPTTLAVNYWPGSIPVYSNLTGLTGSQYNLPDQIDGESYSYFNGVPAPTNSFSINGNASSVNTTPYFDVYNCNAITLVNSSSNTAQYQVLLQSCDANQNVISGLNYSSGFSSTCPTNLKALPGTNGTWLANATSAGYYKVTLQTMNQCGYTTNSALYFKLSVPNSGSNTNLMMNSGTGGSFRTQTTPITSSSEVNYGNPSFNTGYSSGSNVSNNITAYFRKIEEVNCSSGAVIALVYQDASAVTPPNISGNLSGIGIGGLPTAGYYTGKTGKCYKLTLSPSNNCTAISTDYVYYKIGANYKTDETNVLGVEIQENQSKQTTVVAYPNPFEDNCSLSIVVAEKSSISIIVTDINGQVVSKVEPQEIFEAGDYSIPLFKNEMAKGMYFYSAKIGNNTFMGKIIHLAK